MSAPPLFVCSAVHDTHIRYVVDGSSKAHCSDCLCEVWKSPASGRTADNHPGCVTVCLTCFLKRAKEGEDLDIMLPSPEQLKELRDNL